MELQAGSLYEINKQLSANETPLDVIQYNKKLIKIAQWFRDGIDTYAMLLCHERRDFTLFRVSELAESSDKAAAALKECLDNRGQVISIDAAAGNTWEIWLRIADDNENQEDYCYYLFCYDSAIIEV